MQFLKFGGGRRFYAKDFRNAYQFRPDVAPPRQKFQGYINFVPNRTLLDDNFLGLGDSVELRTRLSSLIRTAQLPEVSFNTEIKNSFNRKRIITTGREYAPINLTIFDTIQNEWLTVLMKYFTYNFRDATNKMTGREVTFEQMHESFVAYNSETKHATDSTSKGFDSDAFGYSPSYSKNFFERIDIILYHADKGVQYSLVNPVITTINFGDIDYSDSGFKDFNLSLQYEYFTVHDTLNFDLGESDLDRFERMDGVELPGSRNITKPIATEKPTDITGIVERPRATQVFTQFGDQMVTPATEPNEFYDTREEVTSSGAGSFLDKVSDFFDDSPFGRILDNGLTAALNGGDVKDALLGGLTNEVVQGIQNPGDDTIFSKFGVDSDTNLQVDLGDVVTDGINNAATGLGWRPDSGSDSEGGAGFDDDGGT